MNNKPDVESRVDWKEITHVLIAGAVGGVASFIYGKVMADPLAGSYWSILTMALLGAFAAGIGVYVLTNTDTSKLTRTLFFAALCGFVWKPVCDAGKTFIQTSLEQKQDAGVEKKSEKVIELAAGLTNVPPGELPARLQEVSDAAQACVDSIPQIHNANTRQDVESKINTAMRYVNHVAPRAPEAASRTIQNVGETAALNQSFKISAAAVTSLEQLAPSNQIFAVSHLQLQTNVVNVMDRRFRLERPVNLR